MVEWTLIKSMPGLGLSKGCPAVEQIPTGRSTGEYSLLSCGVELAVVKGHEE